MLRNLVVTLGLAFALACLLLIPGCCNQPSATPQAPDPQAVVAAPPPAAEPAPAGPTFDRTWAAHFPARTLLYGAVRNLDFYNPFLGGPEDPDRMRAERSRLTDLAGGSSFADWLAELNDLLLDQGLVKVSFVELFDQGFGFGVTETDKEDEPEVLLVAPDTDRLEAFFKEFEAQQKSRSRIERSDVGGGELVVMSRDGRERDFCYLRGENLVLVGASPASLKAAVARRQGDGKGISGTLGYRNAVARLQKETAFFLVLNPGPVSEFMESPAGQPSSSEPSASDTAGDPQAMVAQLAGQVNPRERALDMARMVQSVWAQFVYKGKLSHFDLHGSLDPDVPLHPLMASATSLQPLRSPGMASIHAPMFLAGYFPTLSEESADPAAKARIETFNRMRHTAMMMLGLNYDLDVKPWMGNEMALSMLWDGKLPQVALLCAVSDEGAAGATMERVTANFKGSLKFKSQKVAGKTVVVASLSSRPGISPAYTVSGGFLILSSGVQVMESLLDRGDKLADAAGFASLYSVLGDNRLQLTGYLATDLLERLAAHGGPRFAQLQVEMQNSCLKNLLALRGSRLKIDKALCPAGGAYSQDDGRFQCSIHGRPGSLNPLPSAEEDPQLAAARHFKQMMGSIALGLTMSEPGIYRFTTVFRKR